MTKIEKAINKLKNMDYKPLAINWLYTPLSHDLRRKSIIVRRITKRKLWPTHLWRTI